MSPGNRYRNQIDFILINKRWLKCVTNSRAYPGPDCMSDHNLVGVTLRLKIKKQKQQTNYVKLNLCALEDPILKDAYNVEVNNRFEALRLLEEDKPPEQMFQALKTVVKNSAESVLGRAPRRRNRPWISEETLQLMDTRKHLKADRSSASGDRRYREADREVQRAARRDKASWLEMRCAEIQEDLQRHNTKKAYDLIKTLRKGFKPHHRNLKDSQGRVLMELQDILL